MMTNICQREEEAFDFDFALQMAGLGSQPQNNFDRKGGAAKRVIPECVRNASS